MYGLVDGQMIKNAEQVTTDLDKFGDRPQQVGVDGLGGGGHVDVVQNAVNDRLKVSESKLKLDVASHSKRLADTWQSKDLKPQKLTCFDVSSKANSE